MLEELVKTTEATRGQSGRLMDLVGGLRGDAVEKGTYEGHVRELMEA